MSWFRVDDKFHSHPKIKGLRATDPLSLWLLCGSYCADHPKLEGRVSLRIVTDFCRSVARARKLADLLVARGLWLSDGEDSWMFHDWSEYQPSGAEVEARRSELSEKRADAGRKGALNRWSGHSKSDGKPIANADGKPVCQMASDSPFPIPDPDPEEIRSPLPPEGGGEVKRTSIAIGTALADAVLTAYAQGVSAATGKPYDLAWQDRRGLLETVHTHAPPELTGRALVAWTSERAEAYARAHIGRETYERGFGPRGYRAWLNGGARAPSAPAMGRREYRGGQVPPETGSLWRPGEGDPPPAAPDPSSAVLPARPARALPQEPHDGPVRTADRSDRPELRRTLG